MVCLPLKFLPGWLFGVNAARVKPELRDKVMRYQRECYDVLWRAFQTEALARQEAAVPGSLAQLHGMLAAMTQLVEQQMAMESRLDTHDTRLDAHDTRLERMEQRLDRAAEVVSVLQRRVTPTAAIGDEQAAEISGQVKPRARTPRGGSAAAAARTITRGSSPNCTAALG